MTYIIRSTLPRSRHYDDPPEEGMDVFAYWNNDSGWGDYVSADRFTDEEVNSGTVTLPMGGEWCEVVTVSAEEWQDIVELVRQPPAPNAALRALMQHSREVFGE